MCHSIAVSRTLLITRSSFLVANTGPSTPIDRRKNRGKGREERRRRGERGDVVDEDRVFCFDQDIWCGKIWRRWRVSQSLVNGQVRRLQLSCRRRFSRLYIQSNTTQLSVSQNRTVKKKTGCRAAAATLLGRRPQADSSNERLLVCVDARKLQQRTAPGRTGGTEATKMPAMARGEATAVMSSRMWEYVRLRRAWDAD